MGKTEIKKIVRQYTRKLKENKFPVSSVYVFGSRVKGTYHKYSDIDVAVVSPKLKNNFGENSLKLWYFREGVDDRIEPHGFTPADFKNLADPLVYEIRKTGIKVI